MRNNGQDLLSTSTSMQSPNPFPLFHAVTRLYRPKKTIATCTYSQIIHRSGSTTRLRHRMLRRHCNRVCDNTFSCERVSSSEGLSAVASRNELTFASERDIAPPLEVLLRAFLLGITDDKSHSNYALRTSWHSNLTAAPKCN